MKVVVGIPSYNNEETIRRVAEVAARGIEEYFEGDGMILNSDGGSSDGTREEFMKAETGRIGKESFVYEGIPGKGSAMKAIMKRARELGAQAIVFLDADLRSVESWWVERLAGPIIRNEADYVTPYYIRHKYDGTITNHICYPMTSTLYGKKIRQPIGGDFGVGRKAYELYLSKPEDVWKTNVARFGIDIWMTTTAVANGLKILQASLGAKVHDVKDPGKHLSPMFVQVVSTLFSLMIEYENVWKDVSKIEDVPITGDRVMAEPQEMSIDVENLKEKASEGVEDLEFVDREVIEMVRRNGTLGVEEWIDVVFSFATAYRKGADVEKMIPFYFARVAAFAEETEDMSSEEAERVIEEQLEEFMRKKETLVERWFG